MATANLARPYGLFFIMMKQVQGLDLEADSSHIATGSIAERIHSPWGEDGCSSVCMCAGARIHEVKLRPSDFVGVWESFGEFHVYVWAGFATTEKLWWWKKQGKLVDLPATHFAERNDQTRELVWDEVPEGQVIRALVTTDKPLLKVVTRAATRAELAKFGHDRMPVIESPLFSAELPKNPTPSRRPDAWNEPVQGELF